MNPIYGFYHHNAYPYFMISVPILCREHEILGAVAVYTSLVHELKWERQYIYKQKLTK